jgi:hypothetical protein
VDEEEDEEKRKNITLFLWNIRELWRISHSSSSYELSPWSTYLKIQYKDIL